MVGKGRFTEAYKPAVAPSWVPAKSTTMTLCNIIAAGIYHVCPKITKEDYILIFQNPKELLDDELLLRLDLIYYKQRNNAISFLMKRVDGLGDVDMLLTDLSKCMHADD